MFCWSLSGSKPFANSSQQMIHMDCQALSFSENQEIYHKICRWLQLRRAVWELNIVFLAP